MQRDSLGNMIRVKNPVLTIDNSELVSHERPSANKKLAGYVVPFWQKLGLTSWGLWVLQS